MLDIRFAPWRGAMRPVRQSRRLEGDCSLHCMDYWTGEKRGAPWLHRVARHPTLHRDLIRDDSPCKILIVCGPRETRSLSLFESQNSWIPARHVSSIEVQDGECTLRFHTARWIRKP